MANDRDIDKLYQLPLGEFTEANRLRAEVSRLEREARTVAQERQNLERQSP